MRAVSRFSFKFMTNRDIARPPSQVAYERIKGISRSYQCLMIKEDGVLGRGSTGTASPPRSTRGAGHRARLRRPSLHRAYVAAEVVEFLRVP